MAAKTFTYQIVLDVKNGIVQTDQLKDKMGQLRSEIQKVNSGGKQLNQNLGQTASKAGLAGAAIVEIGRTISDSNYGMMAMANNLQQVATLMITLIATSGGLTNAMALLGKAFMGPLGLIVIAQWFIANLESQDRAQRQAKDSADKLTKQMNELAEAYLKAARNGKMYQEANSEVNAGERELADMRLEGASWQQIAAKRTEIIAARIRMLIAEKEAIRGVIGQEEEYEKIGQKILDLRAEQDRILREEFGKREKDEGVETTGLMGLTPTVIDNQLQLANDFLENERILEAKRNSNAKLAADVRMQIAAREAEARVQAFGIIGQAMQDLGQIVGEQTVAGKAVAIAGTLIETFAATVKALNTPGLGLARIPYAISVATFGLAQVARIARVNPKGENGTGSSSPSAPGTEVNPQFNIIGSNAPNRIQAAVEAQRQQPVRAYVTTKDIRSGQELDRNTRSGASLG